MRCPFQLDSFQFSHDIYKIILKLPTKALLEFNKVISDELKNRGDIDVYINSK